MLRVTSGTGVYWRRPCAYRSAVSAGGFERRGLERLSLYARQSQGPSCRAVAPYPRLRPLLPRDPRHADRSFPRHLQGRRGCSRGCPVVTTDFRTAKGGRTARATIGSATSGDRVCQYVTVMVVAD